MSLSCYIKTPYIGLYQNRMKVELDYMYLYYPTRVFLKPDQEVLLNFSLQIKFTEGTEIIPFDILNSGLLQGLTFVTVHVSGEDFYQVVIKAKNTSTQNIMINPGMALGYIKMNNPFKIYNYTNKTDE